LIQSEVSRFIESNNSASLQVEDLSKLEKGLRAKLVSSQGYARRTPLPNLHQAGCLSVPTSIADEQVFYKENYKVQLKRSEAERHDKYCGRGKLRDVMQAKMNDPWGMLIKQDAEKYKTEQDRAKLEYRKSQAKFRDTLQNQINDTEKQKEEVEAVHEEDRKRNQALADKYQQEDVAKRDRAAVARKQVFKDCRQQLDDNADYRRKQGEIRANYKLEFSERVAADQEKATQEEKAKKDYNRSLMKQYMKETEASEKLKGLEKLKDEAAVLKAKKEWEKMLDTSENTRKAFLQKQSAQQDKLSSLAVGKTFEVRYIPDWVLEKDLKNQAQNDKNKEAMWFANRHISKDALVEGLDIQVKDMQKGKVRENAEKRLWNEHFIKEANKVELKQQEILRKKAQTQKSWVSTLDQQLVEFQYDWAYDQYKMNRTDRLHNLRHFELLKQPT